MVTLVAFDQVRPEEAGIVLFVFGIWLAAIALFFNRWLIVFCLSLYRVNS